MARPINIFMKLTKRVLHHRAKPVDFKYPRKNIDLADQMMKFMKSNHGIGLAATQIGLAKRVFVMSVGGNDRACFNPKISWIGDNIVDFQEGCLSFPKESCTIARPDSVIAIYQDANGDRYEVELQGLEARCYQHELDHLDGITMWNRYKEQHAE